MKAKTVITMVVIALFLAVMLILTVSARAIHNASLPHIAIKKLSQIEFPYEYIDKNGAVLTGMRSALAISTELLDSEVFILYQMEKNGDIRSYVRLTTIETGTEHDGFIEVVSGIGYGDKIVISTDAVLYDGTEVYINN